MSSGNGNLAAASLQMDLFSEVSLQDAQPVEHATAVVEMPAQPQKAAVAPTGGSAATAIVETAAVVAGGIADAGEELVANRRNRGRVATTWSDVEGLNDTLKVKETVKGNVWLKPDYQQLIDAGMQPMVAHIVKQVYDSVAAKPAVSASTKTTDAHLKAYMTGLQRIEQGLMQWTQDTKALKAWANSNIRVAGAMLGRQVALSELGPTTSLLEYVYPDGWRAHRDELRIVGGNKLLGALQPGYEEIKRAGKAIDGGWPNKRESWEVQGYKVLEQAKVSVDPNPFNKKYSLSVDRYHLDMFDTEEAALAAAAAIKPFVLVGKRGFVSSFDSREFAVEAAKGRSRGGKDADRQLIEKGYNVLDAERVGVSGAWRERTSAASG